MRLSIKFADEISRIGPQHYTDFGCSRKVRGGAGGRLWPVSSLATRSDLSAIG